MAQLICDAKKRSGLTVRGLICFCVERRREIGLRLAPTQKQVYFQVELTRTNKS